jgi:MinD-like ATPase involved in chromosome partitioning or flagellar assembly
MLGASGRPVGFNGMILPLEAHGVRVISIGFFIEAERPVMWRGPMLHRAIQQFLTDVYWGELDYVLADLPPGTGDVSISLAQMLPGAEMLLVTTPQEAAERVAVLAGKFALANHMKVAGVIENMSYFICPSCDERHQIFGQGGGDVLARDLDAPVLGRIPIDLRLREGSDNGKPLVVSDPDAPASQELLKVAAALPPRPRTLVGKRCSPDRHEVPRRPQAAGTSTTVAATAEPGGTGSPCARRLSRCSAMASRTSRSTSSTDSPTTPTPGSSGTYAPKLSSPRSMITAYPVTSYRVPSGQPAAGCWRAFPVARPHPTGPPRSPYQAGSDGGTDGGCPPGERAAIPLPR